MDPARSQLRSRCSSSRAPARAAARRRTSSCSRSCSATGCDRQRHRLLVDLRRQPADHAVHANADGRGPAWANSLFEDNAEFGLGMRALTTPSRLGASAACVAVRGAHRRPLATELLEAPQGDEAGSRSASVSRLRAIARTLAASRSQAPAGRRRRLVTRSVWIVGGDGWAYDIGYGGLDHVLASGRNVNILVLDTEVYSNTGGQASKSTQRGAVAKFAARARPRARRTWA
jgi:pyruvate-ferredoxin/flavodoxin oxidoreductase